LVETVSLRYTPNNFMLTSDHTTTLARVLKMLEENPTYTADIVGYTDASGSKKANNQLSWRREEVVRRHLTDQAPVIHRISFIGLGEEKADGTKARDAADRQVTIAVYRPD
jgi:outer membrane protein OmpA-like peptidoglycan-associated protein